MLETPFAAIAGKTISRIEGLVRGSDRVAFHMTDGSAYEMYHDQDCCESVSIEDIAGDQADLIGHPLLQAEESSSNENPPYVKVEDLYQDSFTWTFYKLATIKGSVTIRWYGNSNGYYSESVTFVQTKAALV